MKEIKECCKTCFKFVKTKEVEGCLYGVCSENYEKEEIVAEDTWCTRWNKE